MKKILSIILAVFMILGVTSCGKEQNNGTSSIAQNTYNGWYTEGDVSITKDEIAAIVNGEFTQPKNVIVIIGDGMGPNDLTLTEKYLDSTFDFGLAVNQIKNHGLCTTHSASDDITDSAASATALSTGVKTNNKTIGKDPNGNDLKNLSEYAREAGKKVGIVTDDELSGATPSAFVVHNTDRYNSKELTNSMIKFKADVFMCQDHTSVSALLDSDARKIFDNEYLVAKKFDRFKETLDTDPESKKPFIGFLSGYSTMASNELSQCAEVALKRLKNDKGFFLMIESCGTDKYGSRNNMSGKLNSVVTLDRTVATVLKFMKDNPDTLLIVTSDHETGGVKLPEKEGQSMNELLTTKEHTAAPVRVFAVGKGSEYFSGKTVDNTDIAKFLIKTIKGE